MTGRLLARCGSCDAINDVRCLDEIVLCVSCKRDISIIENCSERLPVGVLLGYINVTAFGIPFDKLSADECVNDLTHVLTREGI